MSADHAIPAEIRLFNTLFTVENPLADKSKQFTDFINPNSLEILHPAYVEPDVADLNAFDRFQFERLGYFSIDPDSAQEKLVINRSVELRGDWKKYQKKL